jgi:hypothetical protein
MPPPCSPEPVPLVDAPGSGRPSEHASEHSDRSKSPRPISVPQAASQSGAKNARPRTEEVNLSSGKLKTFPQR